MSQKDYIKRPNPKANNRGGRGKKTTPAKSSPPAPSQSMPVVAMTMALLILGGFGYFLWAINGAAKNVEQPIPRTAAPTVESKPKVAVQSNEPDIPPPPKEQWDYMRELKQKKVEVQVEKPEKRGPWLMQCATFKDSRRAEAFRAQLALLGFESRIKVTKSSTGGYHHRVQLGPYEVNQDAQAARHKLSRHKINGCKIWKWS